MSRKSYPKQFANFLDDKSLFQSSAERFSGPNFSQPTIVTGSDFRFVVIEQLAAVGLVPAEILIEPHAKNTAPAICAAALALDARDPGCLMLVAPADHKIPDSEHFCETVMAATSEAENGNLVTFGIRPTRPETGYGWLELSKTPDAEFRAVAQPLKSFVEKPNKSEAEALVSGGNHLWNSGIFLFNTTAIIDAFEKYSPEILASVRQALDLASTDLSFNRLSPDAWKDLPDISIDYAIMERADNLYVVPFSGSWSDLGDWDAVWRESEHDQTGVATVGAATALDCQNTLLQSTSESQEIVGIGLSNIVAVAMPDAVLIAQKDSTQKVKEAVALLKSKGVSQSVTLPRDYRPWGWYESLVTGPRFQVKRIVVNPGAALSLQSHHHRAEHWVVVEGTAKVTIGEEVKLISENQSVYIPLGSVHRMENPGKVLLTLIEVQTGAYLGEDDIVRYEDVYSRGQGAKG